MEATSKYLIKYKKCYKHILRYKEINFHIIVKIKEGVL